jgi:methylenetetrahydrofolate dehydrogenase (NAD+)
MSVRKFLPASWIIKSRLTIHRANTTTSRRCLLRSFSSSSSSYSEDFWQSPSVVDVTPLADSLRQQVRTYTQQQQQQQQHSSSLRLVGILAEGMGPFRRQDAELYSERIQETLYEDGIDYELWRCTNGDMESFIREANQRPDVHGILIFYPVYPMGPKGPYKNRSTGVYYKTQDDYFRDVVDPRKDVEGLCGTQWLYHSSNPQQQQQQQQQPQKNLVYPCTAMSVQQILEHYHLNSGGGGQWSDQVVSVVNRSEIMGRPLATMLAASGATVYSIDADSILQFRPDGRSKRCSQDTNLEDCLAESNVVVTGVPHPDFQLPTEYVCDGTTVVNVSEFSNVCEESILARPDIKYIPQVGKVTVAVLEQNLVRLHQKSTPSADS